MPRSKLTPSALSSRRECLGLSKLQLAIKLGVSQRAVQHWEDGTRTIPQIAQILLGFIERDVTAQRKKRKKSNRTCNF